MPLNTQSPYTRSGTRRLGDEYQDLIALNLIIQWLEHNDRYIWMMLEADNKGSLDDIVALKKDNTLVVHQVKYSTNSEAPEDPWTWEKFLERNPTKQGGLTPSLLQKWAESLNKIREQKWSQVDASVLSNRKSSPEISSILFNELVSFSQIQSPNTRDEIIKQLGSETIAQEFFDNFKFQLDMPGLTEIEESLRRRFFNLGGTEIGWFNLGKELRTWVINRKEPPPEGKILLSDIKRAALWYSLQSLPQRFEIPLDYVLPSEDFHQQLITTIKNRSKNCIVVTASPGVGKSTYISYLFDYLKNLDIPVIRHHYYLSFEDRSRVIRLDHLHAAESLMHDLQQDYPESISGMESKNPAPNELNLWLETAGKFFSQKSQSLLLLIDGLDHVWREHKSIRELENFLNMILPVPEGVIIMLATQPVEDNKLPGCLLRSAPRSEWLTLPLLAKPSVETWLKHHIKDITGNNNEDLSEWRIERITDALYQKSEGHPLHLRYSLKSLLDRGIQITDENITKLPGCPHEEITLYYGELWGLLSEESREILHLLATCPFPWPREGIFKCMDPDDQKTSQIRKSLSEVEHLLIDSDMGLRVFHSSILTFIETTSGHNDYELIEKKKALKWLVDSAPEYWKWAYGWILEAELGNEEPLLLGPTRQWAIDATVKRFPIQNIDQILEKSIKIALGHQDLPRAVELGLLHEYCDNAYDFYDDVLDKLLFTQLLLEEDDYLRPRLRSNLEELSDQELAVLAKVESKYSNRLIVRRITDTLLFRLKHPKSNGQYSNWLNKINPILGTLALPDFSEPEKVVNWAIRNRNNGYTLEMLSKYSRSVRALLQTEPFRFLLSRDRQELASKEVDYFPNNSEKGIINQEAVLLALEENIDLDNEISYFQTSNPFSAIYSYLRKIASSEPRNFEFPSPKNLFGKDYDISTRDSLISENFRKVFHCLLANLLFGMEAKNNDWLLLVGEFTWARRFIQELSKLALNSANNITEGKPISIGWVYDQLNKFPREKWPDNRDELEFSEASVIALELISFDLFIFSKSTDHQISITTSDISKVFTSSYCYPRPWISVYLNQERNWMTKETVQWVITKFLCEFETTIEEFPTRADAYALLAQLAATHGFLDEAHNFVLKVADNLLAHFHHKDMILNECLDTIELSYSLFSEDEKPNSYSYLLQLAPIIAKIRDFTDGDETGHLPRAIAETLIKINPSEFPKYYLWLCNNDDPYDSLDALHTFLKNIDLSDPIPQAIAKTAIDNESMNIMYGLANSGDIRAQDILNSLFQVVGKFVKDKNEDDYTTQVSSVQKNIAHALEDTEIFNKFPPERGEEFISNNNSGNYQKIEEWARYWISLGRISDVFHAFTEIIDKGYYFRNYDLMFDMSLSLYGKEFAYPWLVRAQVEQHGWYRYHTSDVDSKKRWEIIKELYPDKWLDFIQNTFMNGSLTFYRLIEYLIYFEEIDLVKKMLDQVISCALEFTSPSQFPIPGWIINE